MSDPSTGFRLRMTAQLAMLSEFFHRTKYYREHVTFASAQQPRSTL